MFPSIREENMKVIGFGQAGDQKYFNTLSSDICISRLEIPDGGHANRNAWLTFTVNYRLNFVDSKNPANVVFAQEGKFMAWDSDKTDPLRKDDAVPFVVKDWDSRSRIDFEKRFKGAARFWNEKFLLLTPNDYSGFDFTVKSIPGVVHRPNVLCLFNLDGDGTPVHFPVNVVRAGDKSFRSNSGLLDDMDFKSNTIYHELWHSMESLHIQGILGNARCIVDPNLDECYDEKNLDPNAEANVAGRGRALKPINAKAWIELIGKHTRTAPTRWQASMNTKVPPRRITHAEAAKPDSDALLPIF
jgi:hypothetical protein